MLSSQQSFNTCTLPEVVQLLALPVSKLPLVIKSLMLSEQSSFNQNSKFKYRKASSVAEEIDSPISEGTRNNELTRRCGYLFRKYSSDKVFTAIEYLTTILNASCFNKYPRLHLLF
mgnify:CR=1 FL=1